MNILLNNADTLDFRCFEDLSRVIPDNCTGKPVNFGQGEGQVEINETIWGFYANKNGTYCMTLEEGTLDWHSFTILVESIVSKINQSFGVKIQIEAEGPLTKTNGRYVDIKN